MVVTNNDEEEEKEVVKDGLVELKRRMSSLLSRANFPIMTFISDDQHLRILSPPPC